MKTFKRISKERLIDELNERTFCFNNRKYFINNGLGEIAFHIGLDIVESKTEAKGDKYANFNNRFKLVTDITNYDSIIKQFNLSNSIGVIKTDAYIIKENFNTYRVSIGLEPLNTHQFNKLKEMVNKVKSSGYKLTKDINSFKRLRK
jgi:UV DNA damage repair endonuclease